MFKIGALHGKENELNKMLVRALSGVLVLVGLCMPAMAVDSCVDLFSVSLKQTGAAETNSSTILQVFGRAGAPCDPDCMARRAGLGGGSPNASRSQTINILSASAPAPGKQIGAVQLSCSASGETGMMALIKALYKYALEKRQNGKALLCVGAKLSVAEKPCSVTKVDLTPN